MDSFALAQINLGLQVFLVFLLLASFVLKKRGRFFLHGGSMLVAVILNAVSFVLVMGPSLRDKRTLIADFPLSRLPMVIVVHAILGSIAEILGIWVVVSWRLRSGTQHCARKRKLMRVTFVLWLIALLLGILAYYYLWGMP